jgi:hypothetical protein
MKRCTFFFLLPAFWVHAAGSLSQTSGPPDPYKSTLHRLEALTRQNEAEWRFHTGVPHPEDPGLNDSDWGLITVKNISGPGGRNVNEEHWTGTRPFRRTMKKAEEENALIVRFYEWEGKDSDITLELSPGVQPATLTNLMESPTDNVSLHDGKITLHTQPYEIRTVKVQFFSVPQMVTSNP